MTPQEALIIVNSVAIDVEQLTLEQIEAAEIVNQVIEANEVANTYLKETDWYSIRFSETGQVIPADVKLKREQARNSVIHLEV